jgi:hypothetical protein
MMNTDIPQWWDQGILMALDQHLERSDVAPERHRIECFLSLAAALLKTPAAGGGGADSWSLRRHALDANRGAELRPEEHGRGARIDPEQQCLIG